MATDHKAHGIRAIVPGRWQYICGLTHMRTMEWISLDRIWKEFVQNMQMSRYDESYSWIMAGRQFFQIYNSGNEDKDAHIRFVPLVTADVVNHN